VQHSGAQQGCILLTSWASACCRVKDALDELGLTKVAKSIPGAGILTDAFKGIASLGNTAYDGLMGHYKELKDKLTRFTDIRCGHVAGGQGW
jgi:hypothetical protein